jgi:molybdopterin biosynthesis enzyme
MDGMGQGSTSEGWQDVRRSGFARRVDVAEARRRLAGLLRPTGTERVALAQAAGRVTATAVVAPQHVPAHPVA